VYADPEDCDCIYVGDEQAYQRYQNLRVQQGIAEQQEAAAEMNEDAAMEWDLWGPLALVAVILQPHPSGGSRVAG
jgi:hypothetical protein